ncbi:Sideroflexin-4 [Collichthys lucidus]|uniref:Sideroflexin-4 n=1 Tax=Collichthys lucidus TaxID=240159 RepID=A0A4U5VEK0_COLLU|nr:Sideroflexin-4 [Collichthys lucidus]
MPSSAQVQYIAFQPIGCRRLQIPYVALGVWFIAQKAIVVEMLLYFFPPCQSFLSRLQIWVNLLDPTSLLSSDAEIQKAHARLGSVEKLNEKALPQIFIKRLGVRSAPIQTFFRSILPIPLSAALALFNVFTVRSEESETGIQVFDSSGNPVGLSKAAAEKAVKETALSRAALFGTTAAVPNLLVLLLQRSVTFKCSSVYMDKINSTLIRDLPLQKKTFPEERSAGRSSPSHKCCACSGLDDPRLVQSLSTTRNNKEGKCGGGAAGCSGGWAVILPQRTLMKLLTRSRYKNQPISNIAITEWRHSQCLLHAAGNVRCI